MTVSSGEIFEGIVAVATLGAAGAAAISAFISSKAAAAAQLAVNEARLARQAQLAPRIVLEREFENFHLQWPHPDKRSDEPAYLARKHWKDKNPSPPSFGLTNHGGGPALELEVVFELEDPNSDLVVPEGLASLGLSTEDNPASAVQPSFKSLIFSAGNIGTGMPLYQRQTVDIANCAPGQKKDVPFPHGLLTRIFLRGLQESEHRNSSHGIEPMILSVKISCYTSEGEAYDTQFRFHVFPFYHGGVPIVVHGHFWELPMYPRTAKPRVI